MKSSDAHCGRLSGQVPVCLASLEGIGGRAGGAERPQHRPGASRRRGPRSHQTGSPSFTAPGPSPWGRREQSGQPILGAGVAGRAGLRLPVTRRPPPRCTHPAGHLNRVGTGKVPLLCHCPVQRIRFPSRGQNVYHGPRGCSHLGGQGLFFHCGRQPHLKNVTSR